MTTLVIHEAADAPIRALAYGEVNEPATVVSSRTPLPVSPLGSAAVARQLAAGASSANTALTATARRISIHARGDAIRYMIGTGAQTASGTSHFIAAGERLDLAVPASANIAVIRVTNDATLEVTELGAA